MGTVCAGGTGRYDRVLVDERDANVVAFAVVLASRLATLALGDDCVDSHGPEVALRAHRTNTEFGVDLPPLKAQLATDGFA